MNQIEQPASGQAEWDAREWLYATFTGWVGGPTAMEIAIAERAHADGLASQPAPASDRMENLADYLLRTSPPDYDYERIQRLARMVATSAPASAEGDATVSNFKQDADVVWPMPSGQEQTSVPLGGSYCDEHARTTAPASSQAEWDAREWLHINASDLVARRSFTLTEVVIAERAHAAGRAERGEDGAQKALEAHALRERLEEHKWFGHHRTDFERAERIADLERRLKEMRNRREAVTPRNPGGPE